MSEEDNQNVSDQPDWFQQWLRSMGMNPDMPDYKSAYYPDWYKQAYPLMSAFQENLAFTAGIPGGIAVEYGWNIISRMENARPGGYYESRGAYSPYEYYNSYLGRMAPASDYFLRPSYYMGEAGAAYYRYAQASAPEYELLQAAKLFSYMWPGSGTIRAALLGPLTLGMNVAAGTAEAPYIRQMVNQFGPDYTYAAIQNRTVLFPFHPPDTMSYAVQTAQWGLEMPFAQALTRGVKAYYTGLDPAEAMTRGGLPGFVQGIGYGLQVQGGLGMAEQAAWTINMGQAGLYPELYQNPQLRQQQAENWAATAGTFLAGTGITAAVPAYEIAASMPYASVASTLGFAATMGATAALFAAPFVAMGILGVYAVARLESGLGPDYPTGGTAADPYGYSLHPSYWYNRSTEASVSGTWASARSRAQEASYYDYQRTTRPWYSPASQWIGNVRQTPEALAMVNRSLWMDPSLANVGETYLTGGRRLVEESYLWGAEARYRSYALDQTYETILARAKALPYGSPEQNELYTQLNQMRLTSQFNRWLGPPTTLEGGAKPWEVGVKPWETTYSTEQLQGASMIARSDALWYAERYPPYHSKYAPIWLEEHGYGLHGAEEKYLGPWSDVLHAYTYTTQRGATGEQPWNSWVTTPPQRTYSAQSEADYYAHVMQEDWVKKWIGPLPAWLQGRLEEYRLPIPDVWAWLGREARIQQSWGWWVSGYNSGVTEADREYQTKQLIYTAVHDLLSQGIIQKGSNTWNLQDSLAAAQAISPGLALMMGDNSNR